MKPASFDYVRAASVQEAVDRAVEAGGEARFLAGGQSLIPALNLRLDRPQLLIDLNAIPGLSSVRQDGDWLVIGAMTRHAIVAQDALIARHLPLLAQAVREVAHPAIRNRGTIGGSLALADPAAEMPACAIALRAVIRVEGPLGPREIAADDFFLGTYATALEPGELLTEVRFPLPDPTARHGFAEIARRKGDYATVGLAMMTGPQGRVVWFGLSDRALRDRAAEAALDDGSARSCALLQGLDVWGDLHTKAETKCHLAAVLFRRVLGAMA
ncbi:MAG: FAD binding domain-containing protein [Paracoccaceae bacterium]